MSPVLLAATVDAAPRVRSSGAGAVHAGQPMVRARLLFDASQARPGHRVTAGVLFEMKRGWHIYGADPGQAGLPTRLVWSGDGVRTGRRLWPGARTYRDAGDIVTRGYEGQVLLARELKVDRSTGGRRVLQIRVEARFLACDVRRCVPGRIALRRALALGPRFVSAASKVRRRFERLRKKQSKRREDNHERHDSHK